MFPVSLSFTCLLALVLITAAASTAREGENHFSPSLAFAPGAIPDLKLKRRRFDARPLESGGSSPLSKMLQKASRTRSAVLCRSSSPLSRTVMQGTDAVNVEKAKLATFEQAQKMGMHIGKRMSERLQRGDAASDEEEKALQALLSHSDGARGFYVTTLTAPDIQNVFSTPIDAALTRAITASPDPNAKLLTMNIAMSTATELAHLANGNAEFAKGSALTRDRTRTLISALVTDFPALKQHLTDLLEAITTSASTRPEVEAYRAFLKRWDYDERMREAIATQIRPFL